MATAAEVPVRVAQLVTTMARGGAQLTVLESALVDGRQIDMTVLAGSDRPPEGDFWSDPRLSPVAVVEVPWLKRRIAPFSDVMAVLWLARWLRRERPDVFHTHSTKAGVIGRLAGFLVGVPVVHTVHGWAGALHAGRPITRNLVALTERALAAISAQLVVVGHGDREMGLRLGIGGPDRYRVVRSGIDVESTSRSEHRSRDRARSAFGVDDRSVVIGMVARMAPQKDHQTALAAFARLAAQRQDVALVLIGDGPGRDDVEADIARRRLGDRVRTFGHRSDAAELASGFDIALLASHWEGVPRSLVEAAAAGVPLVATDVGSVADIVVDDVTGFLVDGNDVEALVARLGKLVDDPALRTRLGRAAAERSRDFSADRMRSDLMSLWSEVANRQG